MSNDSVNTPSKLHESRKTQASPTLQVQKKSPGSRNSSRGSFNTPSRQAGHKRVASQNLASVSFDYSSPNKSRLDYTSVPEVSVDLKACQEDINKIQSEHKKQALAEKRAMRHEWITAKKNMKQVIETKTFQHEEFLTSARLELKKMMQEQEKNRKICEQQEKLLDFLEVRDAKKVMREKEKQKELEEIRRAKEKASLRQREMEEKKIRERVEREEKRKAFLETREVERLREVEEKLREKKELEFQHAQELVGKRKLLIESFEAQRNRLQKVEMVLNN